MRSIHSGARTLAALLALCVCLCACGGETTGEQEAVRAEPSQEGKESAVHSHAAKPSREEPVRLAQVFVLPGSYPWDIQESLAAARRAGATAVALRLFHQKGDRPHGWAPEGAPSAGTYFEAPVGSVVSPDLASVFVDAAHAEGLEAWGWMTSLGSRWLLEENPDMAGWRVDPLTGELERTDTLDPFHPEAREHLLALWRALGRTGVDAVLFQDDLVLRHTEGFGPHAAEAYRRERNATLDPAAFYERVRRGPSGKIRVGRYTEAYRRWTAWRVRRLLDLAEELAGAAREASGGRTASCLNVYYDELWTREGAFLWLARDLEAAVERDFDRYVVMAYHRQIGEELGLKAAPELEGALETMAGRLAAKVPSPARAVVKLQSVDWRSGEPLPAKELAQALVPWMEAADFSVGIAPWSPERPISFDALEVGQGGPGSGEGSPDASSDEEQEAGRTAQEETTP